MSAPRDSSTRIVPPCFPRQHRSRSSICRRLTIHHISTSTTQQATIMMHRFKVKAFPRRQQWLGLQCLNRCRIEVVATTSRGWSGKWHDMAQNAGINSKGSERSISWRTWNEIVHTRVLLSLACNSVFHSSNNGEMQQTFKDGEINFTSLW